MFCDPLPLQLLSKNHFFLIFWNGVDLPPSYLDNVFKYTVFFFLGLPLNKFFDPSTPSMRKGCDGKERKEKRIVKIAVHHCHASQPPEHRPTRTPAARAKISEIKTCRSKLPPSVLPGVSWTTKYGKTSPDIFCFSAILVFLTLKTPTNILLKQKSRFFFS